MTEARCWFSPEADAWRVDGCFEARAVLDDDAFRLAAPHEYARGLSRSFFLAIDVMPAEDHEKCRALLRSALTPRRVHRLRREVADRGESRIAAVPDKERLALVRGYLRPLGEFASARLLGIDTMALRELVAGIRVSARARCDAAASDDGAVALSLTLDRLDSVCSAPSKPSGDGLLQTLERAQAPPAMRAALVYPFIEMIAFDYVIDVPETLVRALASGGPELQRLVRRSPQGIERAALEAVRLLGTRELPGRSHELSRLYATRIARRTTAIGTTSISRGSRVVVDLTAACRDDRAFAEPERFDPWRRDAARAPAFGAGTHACLGRHVVLAVAAGVVAPLLARGMIGGGCPEGEPWFERRPADA